MNRSRSAVNRSNRQRDHQQTVIRSTSVPRRFRTQSANQARFQLSTAQQLEKSSNQQLIQILSKVVRERLEVDEQEDKLWDTISLRDDQIEKLAEQELLLRIEQRNLNKQIAEMKKKRTILRQNYKSEERDNNHKRHKSQLRRKWSDLSLARQLSNIY